MLYIVSGLPRSGTSMMMKMLYAGGVNIVKDNLRKPNIDNPAGYFEYEPVKRISEDNSFIDQIDTTLFRPVPRNQPKIGDVILQSSHDATIKLGTELGKSGDNNFNTLSSVIDLHVGKSFKGTSIQNQLGALETNKVPNMLGKEFDLDEGMPDYENDLSTKEGNCLNGTNTNSLCQKR